MADSIGVFFAVEQTRDGITKVVGNLSQPIKVVELDGTILVPEREGILLPGQGVTVWNAPGDPNLKLLTMEVLDGAGVLDGVMQVDTSTSSTNLAQSGTNPRWIPIPELSCNAPFVLTSPRIRFHPTLATMFGDTSGAATILTATGVVNGYIYRLRWDNLGLEPVRYRFRVFN